jgi:hypothetical protein
MNRREFLKSLSAAGYALDLPVGIEIEAASDASIQKAWQGLLANADVFDVEENGALSIPDFGNPKVRADLYFVSTRHIKSASDLASEAGSCQPLVWRLQQDYEEFRNDLVERLNDESLPSAERKQLQLELARWVEEPEEGVIDWLKTLDVNAVENFRRKIDDWLAEEPDWAFEEDYFEECPDGRSAAMKYFQEQSLDDLHLLGVVIVEGDCPGSSYYAAELRKDIYEANLVAQRAGIPIRFVPHEIEGN